MPTVMAMGSTWPMAVLSLACGTRAGRASRAARRRARSAARADVVGVVATSAPVSRLDLPGELEGLAVLALRVDVPGAHVLLVLSRRRRRRLLAEGVDAQRAARRPRGRLERRRAGREEEHEEAAGHGCDGCVEAARREGFAAEQDGRLDRDDRCAGDWICEVEMKWQNAMGRIFEGLFCSHGDSMASARETKR